MGYHDSLNNDSDTEVTNMFSAIIKELKDTSRGKFYMIVYVFICFHGCFLRILL
jgi:hypothetical protein